MSASLRWGKRARAAPSCRRRPAPHFRGSSRGVSAPSSRSSTLRARSARAAIASAWMPDSPGDFCRTWRSTSRPAPRCTDSCPTSSCGQAGAFASGADVVAVAVALALDVTLGDPPNRFHPVAWLGRGLALGRRTLCAGSPCRLLLAGTVLVILAVGAAAVSGALLSALAARAGLVGPLLTGVGLWLLLALRGLFTAAFAV